MDRPDIITALQHRPYGLYLDALMDAYVDPPPQQFRVVLLGCGADKHPGTHPAKMLYRSQYFRKKREYAERSGCPWFIVSAEYGLLAPDQEICDYNKRITDLSQAQRQQWGQRLAAQLADVVPPHSAVVFELHMGQDYRRVVEPAIQGIFSYARFDVPMAGLGIGQQLGAYPSLQPTPCAAPPAPAAPVVFFADVKSWHQPKTIFLSHICPLGVGCSLAPWPCYPSIGMSVYEGPSSEQPTGDLPWNLSKPPHTMPRASFATTRATPAARAIAPWSSLG